RDIDPLAMVPRGREALPPVGGGQISFVVAHDQKQTDARFVRRAAKAGEGKRGRRWEKLVQKLEHAEAELARETDHANLVDLPLLEFAMERPGGEGERETASVRH